MTCEASIIHTDSWRNGQRRWALFAFLTFVRGEVFLCVRYVFGDLPAQGVDAGELHLVAQSFQETQLQFCIPGERHGLEVEQMAFDREGRRTEGRTHADIGDRVK